MSYILQVLQSSFPDVREPKPSWRFIYLSALHAKGTEKITKAVMAAEDAMYARWQEVDEQPDDFQERGQLQEASDELLKIKLEKLGWPKPFPD
jgi:hypothetical protein